MTLEQVFLRFAEKTKLDYRFGFASDNKTKTARFLIKHEDVDFETICFFVEEENIIIISTNLGVNVEYDLKTLKKVNILNGQTKLCAFFLEDMTGEIFAKSSHLLVGTEDEMNDTLIRVLYTTVLTAFSSLEFFED